MAPVIYSIDCDLYKDIGGSWELVVVGADSEEELEELGGEQL